MEDTTSAELLPHALLVFVSWKDVRPLTATAMRATATRCNSSLVN